MKKPTMVELRALAKEAGAVFERRAFDSFLVCNVYWMKHPSFPNLIERFASKSNRDCIYIKIVLLGLIELKRRGEME